MGMRIATASVRTGFAMTDFAAAPIVCHCEGAKRLRQSVSPEQSGGMAVMGMRIATASVRTGFAMTLFRCNRWPVIARERYWGAPCAHWLRNDRAKTKPMRKPIGYCLMNL